MRAIAVTLCSVFASWCLGCGESHSSEDGCDFIALSVTSFTPRAGSSFNDELSLYVYKDGTYREYVKHNEARSGKLTNAQFAELQTHVQFDVGAFLLDFDLGHDRCNFQQHDDAYQIYVSELAACGSRYWVCILPEDVTGAAKAHVDYYLSLHAEMTSGH